MIMSEELVREKFNRMFGSHPESDELLQVLLRYGGRESDRERERVQLAILKLSEGDPVKLRSNVEAALLDYRDVLAWAEYPEQMRSGKTRYNSTRDEYEEMSRRDREQYLQWLEDRENQENIGD
jgi:hypothetical protein